MTAEMPAQNWQDIYYTSQDGLRLYARYYPAPYSRRRPVLCLPGLTRNSRDFHVLASFLSDPHNPRARDVIAVDYRGRGRSQWDRRWRNYSLANEMEDALDLLTIGGLSDVAVVGTSRGGLIAMMMACLRPTAIGTVVLNDVGPVMEREGLVRMIAYVGRVPLPATWAEASELVRGINIKAFPLIPEADWPEIARQWFNDDHGRPTAGYDPMLSRSMSLIDGPAPELWPQLEALARVPTMAIRGELSDLLSAGTFGEMKRRHPGLETVTVRGQGHAPMLRDRSTMIAIDDFIARHDRVPQAEPDQNRLIA
ncbi:MAG: alpha/beta fold hydrolase [Hyphomicrobiaceae bacterium]